MKNWKYIKIRNQFLGIIVLVVDMRIKRLIQLLRYIIGYRLLFMEKPCTDCDSQISCGYTIYITEIGSGTLALCRKCSISTLRNMSGGYVNNIKEKELA